jgi:extracellular factor (EF) 3-hydroxypalmitic acid methyl ester biosynthesis protein
MPSVDDNLTLKQSLVSFRTEAVVACGSLQRLSRAFATFDLFDTTCVLSTSEVLNEFRITSGETLIYSGRATVKDLVNSGHRVLCEVKLDESGSRKPLLTSLENQAEVERLFDQEFLEWQHSFHVVPELKQVVADVESFLMNVRDWTERLEFGLSTEKGLTISTSAQERSVMQGVAQRVITAFNAQHEKFEEIIYSAPKEFRPMHHAYVGQRWQKLFLGSPFGYRTYHKPLGYAGDYEMMNMIHRNQPEGPSLYDKLIHFLLVSQWPAVSVRNRIAHLEEHLLREIARVARAGQRCRVLNVGCGPAREVQYLLQKSAVTDHADFTFIDFNEETLTHVRNRFEELKRQHGRQARLETRKISVFQLLKRGPHAGHSGPADCFDVIYCAGLFDYLADETCRSLVDLFCRSLKPGGLVMVANMKDDKPFRNFIESVLEWHLIYRDARKMRTFAPADAGDRARVEAEPVAVNLFLHVRGGD